MKRIIAVALLFGLYNSTMAQSPYLSLKDPNHPEQHMLNGIITKYALQNDRSYQWYNSSQTIFTASESLLSAMQAAKGKVQFIIFGGTWCEDTQFILPKFFKLQEQASFPDAAISFFAVDRNKKTIGGITEAFKIINVPTIIIMKDGKETGRLVEYGKSGYWDKELAELLK